MVVKKTSCASAGLSEKRMRSGRLAEGGREEKAQPGVPLSPASSSINSGTALEGRLGG